MARRGEIYGGNWINRAALETGKDKFRTLRLRIAGIETEDLPEGSPQRVLTFEGDDRKLGLNATRWNQTAEACGFDPEDPNTNDDEFVGHEIEIFWDPSVMMKGKRTGGIRVRKPAGVADSARAPRPSAPPDSAPPDDAPPGDDNAGPQTKDEAWKAYVATFRNQVDSAATNAQITAKWQADIKEVATEAKKQPSQFGPAEWAKLLELATVPF